MKKFQKINEDLFKKIELEKQTKIMGGLACSKPTASPTFGAGHTGETDGYYEDDCSLPANQC